MGRESQDVGRDHQEVDDKGQDVGGESQERGGDSQEVDDEGQKGGEKSQERGGEIQDADGESQDTDGDDQEWGEDDPEEGVAWVGSELELDREEVGVARIGPTKEEVGLAGRSPEQEAGGARLDPVQEVGGAGLKNPEQKVGGVASTALPNQKQPEEDGWGLDRGLTTLRATSVEPTPEVAVTRLASPGLLLARADPAVNLKELRPAWEQEDFQQVRLLVLYSMFIFSQLWLCFPRVRVKA